jgi:hypothetical protein
MNSTEENKFSDLKGRISEDLGHQKDSNVILTRKVRFMRCFMKHNENYAIFNVNEG